jgi:hypothetical protein
VGELVSSASMLLALASLLHVFWRKDIEEALQLRVGAQQLADLEAQRKQIRSALTCRAMPLSCCMWLLVLIYAPEATRVLVRGVCGLATNGLGSLCDYSAVAASVVVVWAAMVALAVVATSNWRGLRKQRATFSLDGGPAR